MTEICCENCLEEFETDSHEEIVVCPICKQWTRTIEWEEIER